MRTYVLTLRGNPSIPVMDSHLTFSSDDYAINSAERSFGQYFPVFYSAVLWRIEDNGLKIPIAEFKSSIKVVVKKIPAPAPLNTPSNTPVIIG